MKFLFVAFCAPRPNNPMMGLFVHQMAKALVNLGHKVDIFVPVRVFPDMRLLRGIIYPHRWGYVTTYWREWVNLWAGASGAIERDGVQYIYKRFTSLPSISRKGDDARWIAARHARWINATFSCQHYDVIFGHFINTVHLVNILANILHARSVLYVHEDVDPAKENKHANRLFKNLTCMNAILANSEKTRKQVQLIDVKLQGIQTVHLGIDPCFYIESPVSRRFDSNVFKIIYVSRFVTKKNQRLLIEVVNSWNRSRRPVKLNLTLIGDQSPDREMIEIIIKILDMSSFVKISDAVDIPTIRSHLNQAHAFVFPSQGESFGIVAIEAAIMGLPIIAGTNIAVVQELENIGWKIAQFDVNSEEDCIIAIEKLIEEYESRCEYALKLREFVIKEFSWNNFAKKIVELLSVDP